MLPAVRNRNICNVKRSGISCKEGSDSSASHFELRHTSVRQGFGVIFDNYPWMTAFVLITLSRRINPAKNLSGLYPGNDLLVT